MSDEKLKSLFDPYGRIVEAAVIMDRAKGVSKGFGFVTYETAEESDAALAEPTKDIGGHQIFVNLAAKKDHTSAPAEGGVGSGVGTSGDADIALRKLFVRSLSYDTNSNALHEIFSQFGEVAEAVVLTNKQTGASKGFGFVTMANTIGAKKAMDEPTKQINGRNVYVKLAATPDEKTRQNAGGGGGGGGQQQFGMGMGGNMVSHVLNHLQSHIDICQ
jgi:RNA recognition motif-containing protein